MFDFLRPIRRPKVIPGFATPEDIAVMPMFLREISKELDPSIEVDSLIGTTDTKHFLKYTGDGPFVILAPNNAGKQSLIFVPACLNWTGPLICNDNTGEVYNLCAFLRYDNVGPVVQFLAGSDLPTCQFNPLDTIPWGEPEESSYLHLLTQFLFDDQTPDVEDTDKLAAAIVRNLIKDNHKYNSDINLKDIRILAKNLESEKMQLRINDICRPYFTYVNTNDDFMERKIDIALLRIEEKLSVFDEDKSISFMFSKTSFDLTSLNNKNYTVYIGSVPGASLEINRLMKFALKVLINYVRKFDKKTLVLLPENLHQKFFSTSEDTTFISLKNLLGIHRFYSVVFIGGR